MVLSQVSYAAPLFPWKIALEDGSNGGLFNDTRLNIETSKQFYLFEDPVVALTLIRENQRQYCRTRSKLLRSALVISRV
jgi:hypothetical protein